jgi:hypothetical protein
MKAFLLFISLLFSLHIQAQNLTGKWYGKLTQGPGGFRETYDFELDFNAGTAISGISYAYVPFLLDAKIGFEGFIDGDTIRIRERKNLIIEENTPLEWVLCIKTLSLAVWQHENKEFLRGRWVGVNKETGAPCIAGLIVLARDRKDLKQFIAKRGDRKLRTKKAVIGPAITKVNSSTLSTFSTDFNNNKVKKIKEIEVENKELYIILSDYDKIDDDTVSVYLNRETLVEKVRIDHNAYIVNFTVDEVAPINELLLFAENQGSIPPNTVKMTLIDGKNSHKILIDTDKYRSAAVYLKVIPAAETELLNLSKQKTP